MRLTPKHLDEYTAQCRFGGQSEATIKVKHRNLRIFVDYCAGAVLTTTLMAGWRAYIAERYTKAYSRINMVCKTNVFLDFLGLPELKIKSFDVERRKLHSKRDEGLTLDELKQLLDYTEKVGKTGMNLLLHVLATTGIRSGEIAHITIEAVDIGFAEFVHHRNPRKVLLPDRLRTRLKEYAHAQGIRSGAIFVTRNGTPIHQRNIGSELKKIAAAVDIPKDKVNPTAFRILFAKTYYEKYGDLSGLTDLLGVKDLNMSVLYIKEDA